MSKAAVDLKFRSEGVCRLCRRPYYVRPLTRHRLVPGRFGGTYTPINCVPLCRACHDQVESKASYERISSRRMLRASLWPIEVAQAKRLFAQRGLDFDRAYPPPPRDLVLARRSQYATAS